MNGGVEPASAEPRWHLPDITQIFEMPSARRSEDKNRAQVLEDTLASFGIGATVIHVDHGPAVTRYELKPDRGVRISRILARSDDIALALGVSDIRMEAPIPGKAAIGIEVPNDMVSIVSMREVLDAMPADVPPLRIALGEDIAGRPVVCDLTALPHLLVGGAPGTGKSTCLNSIIASLLAFATPDQIELVLIDTRQVEFAWYNGIPHLKTDVITDPPLAAGALLRIAQEMDQRYSRFARFAVRKIDEYNATFPNEKLPHIIVVIDELAELLVVGSPHIAVLVERLTAHGRPAGIHLVVTTPLPATEAVGGLLKANIPSRIACAVASRGDSRTILGENGAEQLRGRGDMLFRPVGISHPIRLQGALVTNSEIERLVEHWKRQGSDAERKAMEITPIREDDERGGAERKVDDLWYDAAKFLLDAKVMKGEAGVGSTAALQARFSIGHPRAVRLMKQLEEFGIVGPNEGTKPRNVIIESPADLERLADRYGKPAQTDLFAG